MPDLPDAAITAAADRLSSELPRLLAEYSAPVQTAQHMRLAFEAAASSMLEAAAPALRAQGAATERAKLAAVILPDRLRMLATWFDVDDAAKGRTGREVQADLRRFADLLDGDDG